MNHLLDLDPKGLKQALADLGQSPYRASQILEWVYEKGVLDYAEMTNLSKDLRERLAEGLPILAGHVADRSDSDDGVSKLLIDYPSDETPAQVETVMIPTGQRATACVSTQAGCAMGCRFCASGMDGLQRNLTTGEIVEQVLQLWTQTGRRATHVVYMGMGEPLANLDAVVASIHTMIGRKRFGLSARRITVSTIGLPNEIEQLAEEDLPITLAVSLHAPNDALRTELMPATAAHPIAEVMDAAGAFFETRGREVTLEYALLAGVNDAPAQADELADIAHSLRCNVNLIRYNPTPGLPFEPPGKAALLAFNERLKQRGVNVSVRKSRGIEAQAACGQLRQRNRKSS